MSEPEPGEAGDLPEGRQADPAAELAKVEAALAGQEALRGLLPAAQLEALLADLRAKKEILLAAVGNGAALALGAGSASATLGGMAAGRDFHVHLPPEPPGPVGPSPVSLRKAYLLSVLRQASLLDLSGIDPTASQGRAASLRLQALYTALLTLSPEEREAEAAEEGGLSELARGLAVARRQSALAQLDRHDRLVLLGEPGGGKSTFVNFVALCLAGALLEDPEVNLDLLRAPLPGDEGEPGETPQPWSHGALFPVRIVLRDFAARGLPPAGTRAEAGHLWDFLRGELTGAGLAGAFPLVQTELQEGRGLLLLDGLDEVPEAENLRHQLRRVVEEAARCLGRTRVIVTSRTYAYQNQGWRLQGFAEAVLAPFSAGQIQCFVTLWYRQKAAEWGRTEEAVGPLATLLRRGIFGSDRLRELASRPLLLALIAGIHAARGGSLPERRGDLYEEAVKLLLHTWDLKRWEKDERGRPVLVAASLAEWLKVDQEEVRQALEAVAFQVHAEPSGGRETADIREIDLVDRLLTLSRKPGANAVALVDYLQDRAGLLVARGEKVYSFPHRTFQEYLAACHLTNLDYPKRAARLGREDPERWREVVLLAGAKAKRGAASSVWSLAESLCYREPEAEEVGAPDEWGALLAGQTLVESADLGTVAPEDQPKLDRVRRWSAALLRRERFPARERAAAGKALAVLGDPRFDPASWFLPAEPDLGFVPVPAGPFRMGSERSDEAAEKMETPAHDVELPAFWISRFPVTVAQLRVFVEASGHELRDRDGLSGVANHPAVLVTWYDALAYCRWLGERLAERAGAVPARGGFWEGLRSGALRASLPSEAEWEKAARGLQAKIYPWGEEPDPNRANYRETGLFETSAVGAFSGGASVFGCEEMSGNVWEWTRSLWGEDWREPRFGYPYRAGDGREDLEAPSQVLRVLRGGAFNSDRRGVRCASRYWLYPDYRNVNIGFRVVLSPFPL